MVVESGMAMGTRKQRERQEPLWYRSELPEAPGHPFYKRLNEVLEREGFDRFCEERCCKFYHEKLGRPSLAPGLYFRLMMIGFFEGLDSERGIAWRVADSLTLRRFLQIGLDERTPDHVTISRTRRLIGEVSHQEVFGWVLKRLARGGLIKGKTIGIDSTTLEANAAMKSIVRRDTQESYTEYLKRLAQAEAKATEVVSEAVKKGDVQALNYIVAQAYVTAMGKIVASPNSKLVLMPLELSSLASTIAGIGELAKKTLEAK